DLLSAGEARPCRPGVWPDTRLLRRGRPGAVPLGARVQPGAALQHDLLLTGLRAGAGAVHPVRLGREAATMRRAARRPAPHPPVRSVPRAGQDRGTAAATGTAGRRLARSTSDEFRRATRGPPLT